MLIPLRAALAGFSAGLCLFAQETSRTLTIRGQIRAGQTFERPFGPYLFRLKPAATSDEQGQERPDGWRVEILPMTPVPERRSTTTDLAQMATPPFSGPSPLDIQAPFGAWVDTSASNTVAFWLTPEAKTEAYAAWSGGGKRQDAFQDHWLHPERHRDRMGLCTLTYESLGYGEGGPTLAARLTAMTFTATLAWQDSAPFDAELGLTALYGPADPATGLRTWHHAELGSGRGPVKAEALQMIPFHQGERERLLLLAKVNEAQNDCHACQPGLGVALYTRQGGQWTLDRGTPFVTRLGHSGVIPQGQLLPRGEAPLTLLFRTEDARQGVLDEHAQVVLENEKGFAQVLEIPATAGRTLDDRGPSWGFSSTIRVVPENKVNPPTLEVISEGTKSRTWRLEPIVEPDDGPLAPFRLSRVYRFKEGAYQSTRTDQLQPSPFPLHAGMRWTYRVKMESGPVRDATTWTMRILDARAFRDHRFALVEGFFLDLLDVWNGGPPDQKPRRQILVWTPAGELHALPLKRREMPARLPDPETLLTPFQPSTVVLQWPLGPEGRFAVDDDPAPLDPSESRWSWNLLETRPAPRGIRGWKGSEPGSAFIYRTNPDHQIWTFVPGLGAANYTYSHHGSREELEATLVSVSFPGKGRKGRR